MSVCVNENCRRSMDDKWAFCPMCGSDNRAPKFRPAILQCSHEYFEGAVFCSKCGMPVRPLTPTVGANDAPSFQLPGHGAPVQGQPGTSASGAQLPSFPRQGNDNSVGYGVIGWLLLIGGGLCTAYFFLIFDPSVEVPSDVIFGQQVGGGRVNNIGLMADRQNGILVGIAATVIGLILVLFAESQKKRP